MKEKNCDGCERPLKENEYKCAMCKEVSQRDEDWTREKMLEEYKKNFGTMPIAGADNETVCDDCYNKVLHVHELTGD